MSNSNNRGTFGTKLGVILAAAGSAVGLGNVWRFPTQVSENGGAAFILVYLLCVAMIGMPLMISEFVVGRHTHANTASAYKKLAPGKPWWWLGGAFGVLTAFIIMCYYVVVSGWTLFYMGAALAGRMPAGSDDKVFVSFFKDFVRHPYWPLVCALLVMLMVFFVISKGVQHGIERFSKLMMPLLFIIILVLVVCSVLMPDAQDGINFLLKPDFSQLTTSVVLSAMGQAFFSLSLAMGCLCTYASYFRNDTRLARTAYNVGVIDTVVAVMCGFIIFPALFSSPDLPRDGAGLVFATMPKVFVESFGHAPVLAYVFSVLFYLLLLLAALTSAISLHEVVTAYVTEAFNTTRRKAAVLVSVVCLLLGIPCSLSFGLLNEDVVSFFGMNCFDFFDFVASKILMPVGGFATCLFAGWYLKKKLLQDEVTNRGTLRVRTFHIYLFLLKYVAPLAMLIIFVNELFHVA